MLLNILNNSIDAYENSQNSNKVIEIKTQIIEDRVVISIKDNAGGITKENIKAVSRRYRC